MVQLVLIALPFDTANMSVLYSVGFTRRVESELLL